jgi:hypothetical protein
MDTPSYAWKQNICSHDEFRRNVTDLLTHSVTLNSTVYKCCCIEPNDLVVVSLSVVVMRNTYLQCVATFDISIYTE